MARGQKRKLNNRANSHFVSDPNQKELFEKPKNSTVLGVNGYNTERVKSTLKSKMKAKFDTNLLNMPSSDRRHKRSISEVLGPKASKLPKFEKTKTILKKFGKVTGFGVNTHKGCVRNYNEDRVSILLNA